MGYQAGNGQDIKEGLDGISSRSWIGHQVGAGQDIKQGQDGTSSRDWMGYQAGTGWDIKQGLHGTSSRNWMGNQAGTRWDIKQELDGTSSMTGRKIKQVLDIGVDIKLVLDWDTKEGLRALTREFIKHRPGLHQAGPELENQAGPVSIESIWAVLENRRGLVKIKQGLYTDTRESSWTCIKESSRV